MSNKKWEGVEYRSKDFNYPRSSREVFGRNLTSADFGNDKSKWADVGDIAVVVVCLVIAVYLMFFGVR